MLNKIVVLDIDLKDGNAYFTISDSSITGSGSTALTQLTAEQDIDVPYMDNGTQVELIIPYHSILVASIGTAIETADDPSDNNCAS